MMRSPTVCGVVKSNGVPATGRISYNSSGSGNLLYPASFTTWPGIMLTQPFKTVEKTQYLSADVLYI
jgi:hypothetical protein